MKILKNISGELLAIAYLPKERRNPELEDLSIIVGEYKDSDLPKEQKELILEIIKDLIRENTPAEGFISAQSKPTMSKKQISKVEVFEPEVVEEEPKVTTEVQEEIVNEEPKSIVEEKIETIQPVTSIEDIDDAF
jgi:hypothetical protein